MFEPIELLKDLVRIPSPSGAEDEAQDHLARVLEGEGIEVHRTGRNLWCSVGEGRPTLLLNAHMDTVPASERWTRDPHGAEEEDGRLYGLGVSDDKASIVAMAAALVGLREAGVPGTVIFASTCDEETGGEGLEVLRREIPPAEAAVIGEPTNLRVATAQRGMIRLAVVAEGRAAHAARPHEGVNAIELAMDDIQRLRAMKFTEEHPCVGLPTVQVTEIAGGVARNMIAPECSYTVDVRTTPEYDNDWFVPELRRLIRSRINELKGRITPVETRTDERIVQSALRATETVDPIGFGGVSDLYHVRDLPAIVLGPGHPDQSHQADECLPLDQLSRAVVIYRRIALDWCRGWHERRGRPS